jgi:hypothetical protein
MAKRRDDQQTEERFEIQVATRRAVPQVMSIYGVQFSGKTLGALFLAAGMVDSGNKSKIGFIDTENGRGRMYADDPDVMRLIPQGYHVIELHPPFHPKRYIGAIRTFEEAGYHLVITDSGSHAREGDGGCLDIKEKDKGWANAKLWNKRFMAAIRYSGMHHIVCLRAMEKTKIITVGGKQEYVPLGILPICEKSFPFDLGLSFSVEGEIDGKPATHLARPVKWPKAMNPLFENWQPQLLTSEIGRRIREWNNSAGKADELAQLQNRARLAALEGTAWYREFYNRTLTPTQKKMLTETTHKQNKELAEQTDRDAAEVAVEEKETTTV